MHFPMNWGPLLPSSYFSIPQMPYPNAFYHYWHDFYTFSFAPTSIFLSKLIQNPLSLLRLFDNAFLLNTSLRRSGLSKQINKHTTVLLRLSTCWISTLLYIFLCFFTFFFLVICWKKVEEIRKKGTLYWTGS